MAASTSSVLCQRPLATRSAARPQVVCSAARPQQKQNKLAQIAVAGLAAAVLSVSGSAIAAEGAPGQGPMKSKICASNPTAKICTKDSVPKTASTSGLN
ncbi:hypothetical protein WJX74_010801 [Apatococcus lobatus]|uniref:Uncharacterized protein n=1 Tax=Apatococcus lobatus TaxID=904363 RepID=A0AAW1QW11_9CHLO